MLHSLAASFHILSVFDTWAVMQEGPLVLCDALFRIIFHCACCCATSPPGSLNPQVKGSLQPLSAPVSAPICGQPQSAEQQQSRGFQWGQQGMASLGSEAAHASAAACCDASASGGLLWLPAFTTPFCLTVCTYLWEATVCETTAVMCIQSGQQGMPPGVSGNTSISYGLLCDFSPRRFVVNAVICAIVFSEMQVALFGLAVGVFTCLQR